MAKRLHKSFARLEKILERQAGPTRWFSDYQPANTISDADVPRQTRPSALWDPYFQRFLQAQAITERPFLLLARHNPAVFDVHEQHMLPFNPSPHPLANHETTRGLILPGLRGTMAITESLGCLNMHPTVRVPATHSEKSRSVRPFPYIGDILVFLRDSLGLYAVNWSIKASEADFYRTFRRRYKPPSQEDRERAALRHEIERLLFLDGQIPTHKLHPGLIDETLRVNLLNLFYWYSRDPLVNDARDRQAEVTAWYGEQLHRTRVMYDLAKEAAGFFKLDIHDAKWILKTAIFSRRLRVDLFRLVADNFPLYPENINPFDRYSEWFRRSV